MNDVPLKVLKRARDYLSPDKSSPLKPAERVFLAIEVILAAALDDAIKEFKK